MVIHANGNVSASIMVANSFSQAPKNYNRPSPRTQVQSTEGGGDALASDAGHSTSAASVASYDGHTSSVETMPVQQHHHDHSYDHGHDSYDATEYEQEHQEAGPWITLFDPDSQVSQPVSQSVS